MGRVFTGPRQTGQIAEEGRWEDEKGGGGGEWIERRRRGGMDREDTRLQGNGPGKKRTRKERDEG